MICVAGLVNVSPAGTNAGAQAENAEPTANGTIVLQREGSKVVKAVGYFRQASGRLNFTPKDNTKASYICLENLMLQRVGEELTNQTDFGEWIVNGELTEYRNSNYLIVKTAQQVD